MPEIQTVRYSDPHYYSDYTEPGYTTAVFDHYSKDTNFKGPGMISDFNVCNKFDSFMTADAKSTTSYSSDLHFLGIIM